MILVLGRRSLSFARKFSSMSYSTKFGDPCPYVLTPSQLHDLVTSKSQAKDATDLVIFDASWHMPNSTRNAKKEYEEKRIPNARFLDLDKVASPHELSLSHMMPDPETFARACSMAGVRPSTHVVIYDTHGVFSSPRALYMFRAFGHHRSSILDGGLRGWQAHGGATDNAKVHIPTVMYTLPTLDEDVVKDYNQIVSNADRDPLTDPDAFYVLDARPKGRFLGVDPEPRPGLPSGHMPHAISLPFNVFLENHTMPSEEGVTNENTPAVTYTRLRSTDSMLASLSESLGHERAKEILEGKRAVVTSCGSGMTAGIIWLGLKLLGVQRVGLYDESWTGYAMRKKSNIVSEK